MRRKRIDNIAHWMTTPTIDIVFKRLTPVFRQLTINSSTINHLGYLYLACFQPCESSAEELYMYLVTEAIIEKSFRTYSVFV